MAALQMATSDPCLHSNAPTEKVRLGVSVATKGTCEPGLELTAGVEVHEEAGFGAEGDGEERLDGFIRREREAEALGDGGEQKCGFRHGEAGADADSGATAEGKIGEARKFAVANRIVAPA